MNFLRKLIGDKPSATPADWSYYEDETNGVRLPYLKDWEIRPQPDRPGMMVFLPPDRKVAGGGLVLGHTDFWELSMTFSVVDKAMTGMADVDDRSLGKMLMNGVVDQSHGTIFWEENGKLPRGQRVIRFGYSKKKNNMDMKTICAFAHDRNKVYIVEISGLTELMDARLDEWKGIAKALEIG